MSEPWYRTVDMLPPLRAHVRVSWAGRIFEAIRAVHPKRKKYCWATMDDGEIVYLPPKGRSKIWGDNPELWQPADATRWPHDLPEPVLSNKENITENSRNSQEPHVDALWWRDATAVTYSQPGQIAVSEAEGRIMRALNTGWRIAIDGPRSPTNADVLNRIAALNWKTDDDPDDAPIVDKDWRPPFQPTGADHDDYLTASGWFVQLNPLELWPKRRRPDSFNRPQHALIYRALDPPASWAYMANKWGTTPERAKKIYVDALDQIWRAANGLQVLRSLKPVDQLGLLKERNRRYGRTR